MCALDVFISYLFYSKMSLVNNKSESDRIQQLKNRTLYANYLAVLTKFQGGCDPILPSIQTGSGAFKEASVLIDLRLGALYTSGEERDAIISINRCPSTNIPIVYILITTDSVLHLEASSYSGTGTTWTDLSTAANNGTLINTPSYVASPVKSFTLTNAASAPSGTNQRVNLSKNNIGDDFTIAAWIKTTSAGKGNVSHLNLMWIVGAETSGTPTPPDAGDFGFGICQNGKLGFGCSPQDFSLIQSTNTVNTGSWVNVVMTRARITGAIKLYVNGLSNGSGTLQADGSVLNRTTPTIGFPGGIEDGYAFNGSIGGILFYTRVLTAVEAYNNYEAQKDIYGF